MPIRLPGYVLGLVKDKGQPLQLVNAFEKPVSSKNGLMDASIAALKEHHEHLKKTWGIKPWRKSPSPTSRWTSSARRFCAMSDTAYLALLLDGPLQSWGFASRFQRRTTGLHPTKSGVVGLICAAMGLAKGSAEEQAAASGPGEAEDDQHRHPASCRREYGTACCPSVALEDFHTVLDTRRASGAMNKDAVVTRRQYLLDARFGVILAGRPSLLERVAAALQDPVWGVWFGPQELHSGRTDVSSA